MFDLRLYCFIIFKKDVWFFVLSFYYFCNTSSPFLKLWMDWSNANRFSDAGVFLNLLGNYIIKWSLLLIFLIKIIVSCCINKLIKCILSFFGKKLKLAGCHDSPFKERSRQKAILLWVCFWRGHLLQRKG